jgi:two-component system, cell cycle response regulator
MGTGMGGGTAVANDELTDAVEALEEQSRYQVPPEETLAQAREVIAASRAAGRPDLRMRARLIEGDLLYRRGLTAAGGRIFRRVNHWANEHADFGVLARSHRRLAEFFTHLGNPQLALEHAIHAAEALDLDRDNAPDRLRVRFVLTLADAYADTGALAEARARYAEAERLSQSVDDVWTQLRVINNLAFTEYEAGDLEAADRTTRRLVAVAHDRQVDLDLYARETLARVQLAAGRLDDAVATLLPVLDDDYAGRFAENSARADALLTLAEAQRRIGDLPQAEAALEACRRLCADRGLAAIRTRARQEEAELLAEQGRFREAYQRYKEFHAETMARNSAERDARARALQAVFETNEARRAGERARQLSLRDPLTHLYNRRYVDTELPALLRRAAGDRAPLSVALLDIDHFKQVNDVHSHEVGDLVLEAVARLAAGLVADGASAGFAARLGGEEFLLVLPGAGPDAAHGCAEQLRQAIRRHDWPAIRTGLAVTASIGVATAPHGTGDHRALLRLADANLYAAKRAGRDRTVTATGG